MCRQGPPGAAGGPAPTSSFGCTPRGMTPASGACGCEWKSRRCASAWKRSRASSGGSSRTGPGSSPLGRPGGGDGTGWRCPRRWRSETFPVFVPGVGDCPKRGREGWRESEGPREKNGVSLGEENKISRADDTDDGCCMSGLDWSARCSYLLRRWRFGGRYIHPLSWSPLSVEMFRRQRL